MFAHNIRTIAPSLLPIYSGNILTGDDVVNGNGTGINTLNMLECNGSESRLVDCPVDDRYRSYCSAGDAGVSCRTEGM